MQSGARSEQDAMKELDRLFGDDGDCGLAFVTAVLRKRFGSVSEDEVHHAWLVGLIRAAVRWDGCREFRRFARPAICGAFQRKRSEGESEILPAPVSARRLGGAIKRRNGKMIDHELATDGGEKEKQLEAIRGGREEMSGTNAAIVDLVLAGATDAEIADALDLAGPTAEARRQRANRLKLKARNELKENALRYLDRSDN